MAKRSSVLVDIPCDVQQVDETGFVWTFLEEARDPSLITEGAIVIAADELDPVIARVVSLTPEPQGTVVRLEILPGDPWSTPMRSPGLGCCPPEPVGMDTMRLCKRTGHEGWSSCLSCAHNSALSQVEDAAKVLVSTAF
jgi:hypothetical protein